MYGLSGKAIRPDFHVKPENMNVNEFCKLYLRRQTILSKVKKSYQHHLQMNQRFICAALQRWRKIRPCGQKICTCKGTPLISCVLIPYLKHIIMAQRPIHQLSPKCLIGLWIPSFRYPKDLMWPVCHILFFIPAGT